MSSEEKIRLSYRSAGVNIDAGDNLVKRLKPHVSRTHREGWITGIGGFGGLFELPVERYQAPVLVSGTDGVGTKLKTRDRMDRHDTIGIDLVAMCVNDVIVCVPSHFIFSTISQLLFFQKIWRNQSSLESPGAAKLRVPH